MNADTSQPERFCLSCRHSLRGISSRNCPECGREFDPNDPWTTSPSASRFNREALVWMARVLIAGCGVLVIYCFIIALMGLDPFPYLWVPGYLFSWVLAPWVVSTVAASAWPALRLRRWQRVCGVLFPLLIASVVLTYWPFQITFLLHKHRLAAIADQVAAGHPPALPVQVGPFQITFTRVWEGNIGLYVPGDASGGLILVLRRQRPDLGSDLVWYNTNWRFNLGGGWYYVEED